ncbi:MAG TPA: SRPBCC family protein [Bauldia sp.]|nr:SRPBCC family protein [Bauldia sp.]
MTKKLTVEVLSDREILVRREFNAPRQLVFDAHTKPELVRKWLTGPPGWTMPVCKIDLRVGGKYRYEWRNASGEELAMGGTFREVAAPERLVSAELFDVDWTGGETINTQVFTEAGGKTTLALTVRYASLAARDAALKTGMTTGMEMSYANLDAVLAAA